MKHTSGPWRVARRKVVWSNGMGSSHEFHIEHGRSQVICNVGIANHTTEANAHLIAAAPELLNEGQARIKVLECLLACYRLEKKPPEKLLDELDRARRAWEAAVAKAEETP